MQIKHLAILALFLVSLGSVWAISTDDAISIVQTKNNFINSDETAVAIKQMVAYQGQDYIIVTAQKNSTVTCYIPVKASDGNIASNDIEIRDLIRASIVLTRMTDLQDNTPVANWIFSYSTKSYFTNLQNDFTELIGSVITVQTKLDQIGSDAGTLTQLAEDTRSKLDALAIRSGKLSDEIDAGRKKETDFLSNPDTNAVLGYENQYTNIYSEFESYKSDYTDIESNLTKLSQGIGALGTSKLTLNDKQSLQKLLSNSTNIIRLPSFFDEEDQLRTPIESVFTDSKNSDLYANELATRKARNDAWQLMYGQNYALQSINPDFDTLQKAADNILSTDYVDQWQNQDAVSGLKAKWSAAQTRFNNAEYDKAKEYAKAAQDYVKQIMADGFKAPAATDSNDLITKVVAGLVIVVIIVFAYDKFFRKKKKPEDDYNEP